jgi:hypothetical protein
MLLRSRRSSSAVEVGREGVVVVADGRLAGAAEAATVVADHAVTRREELALLSLPRVPVQGIPVDQHDRIAAAVVLVVDLDRGSVLASNDE